MPDVLKTSENCPRRFKDMVDGTFAETVAIARNGYFKTHFGKALASSADSAFWTQIGATGAGMGISQTSGALLITTGTTANSEVILRSNYDFGPQLSAMYSAYLSQRIANQLFYFELVDVIGDNLSFTINSAVSVTVTFPTSSPSPFNSTSVGQSVNLGAISGAAGIPGRYVIASVSGNSVTFTVASWPTSGAGTLSLFGLNFHRIEFSGTTATTGNYDCGRSGYASGNTAVTVNTTANPGHVGILNQESGQAAFFDMLAASATAPQTTLRATRSIFLPDENVRLFFQIRVQNGTTNPASTTTLTMTAASVTDYNAVNVTLQSQRAGTQISSQNVVVNAGTSNIGQADLYSPTSVTDVTSAAITSTNNSSTFTPAIGTTFSVAIPVTAVSGTNPTMDVTIQESDDGGTNWYNTYDFPRITAAGIYRSPQLPVTGNRVRYAQTIGGTTPSFTRSIVRMRSNTPAEALVQMIDRTINFNTLNSTTPSVDTRNTANQVKLVVNTGAITTTAPQFQLEGSEDYGSTWVAIGSPLTAVASSTVSTNTSGANWPLLRARVSTAGVGATAGYVLIKGHD